jgi:hypothetical protein
MKKTARNSFLAFAFCSCLALAFAGCQGKSPRNPLAQHELFGRPSPTPANTQFLTNYRQQLADANNPHDLQRWAMEMINTLPRAEQPVRIDLANVPLHSKPGQSENRSRLVGYLRAEPNQERYISLNAGGGGAFGWYGIMVGKPTFRPSDNDCHYLEWIPGCYVFYTPPI